MELACPMCSLVCTSSSVLQEHVELHLEEQPQADGTEPLLFSDVVVSSSVRRWLEEGCVLPCSEALQQRLRWS